MNILENICKKAVASDINKGPLEKAKLNVMLDNLNESIDVRLGPGLETVKPGEIDALVIAGMGGNLIIDILEEDMPIACKFKFMILQPAQNPEVLRKYLYTEGYEIIDEDICFDEGVYYELFKVRRDIEKKQFLDELFYEFSPILIQKKHKVFKEYLSEKRNHYKKILSFIKEDTQAAKARRQLIEKKILDIDSIKEKIYEG